MYGQVEAFRYMLESDAKISKKVQRAITIPWNRTIFQYKLMKIRGNLPDFRFLLLEGQPDLVLGGYGGSANSFTNKLIEVLSDDLDIAHHIHQIGLLRVAMSKEIPTIVNIRKPEMAISSVIVRFREDDDIAWSLARYITYYKYVVKNLDNILVVGFKEITNDTEKAVKRIEKFTGYNFTYNDIKEKEQLALSKLGDGLTPDKKRNHKKEKLREVIPEHNLYPQAKRLFDKCMER